MPKSHLPQPLISHSAHLTGHSTSEAADEKVTIYATLSTACTFFFFKFKVIFYTSVSDVQAALPADLPHIKEARALH